VKRPKARPKPAPYMTPEEVATFLSCHVETVRKRAREGKLEGAVRMGRGWRFPSDVIVGLLKAGKW